jgi:hypothetical protein
MLNEIGGGRELLGGAALGCAQREGRLVDGSAPPARFDVDETVTLANAGNPRPYCGDVTWRWTILCPLEF